MAEEPIQETADSTPQGKGGFLATQTGRMALVGGAVAALLVVFMVIGAFLFISFRGGEQPDTEVTVQPPSGTTPPAQQTTQTTPPSVESTTVDEPIEPVGNEHVFQFRDLFLPLLKENPPAVTPVAGTGTTTGGTTGGTTTGGTTTGGTTTGGTTGGTTTTGTTGGTTGGGTGLDTLVLQDIVTDNGTRKAVLELGGETFTLAAGERLEDTPWKVLRVGDSSVTLLFGDSQVVLTVGQGIQK